MLSSRCFRQYNHALIPHIFILWKFFSLQFFRRSWLSSFSARYSPQIHTVAALTLTRAIYFPFFPSFSLFLSLHSLNYLCFYSLSPFLCISVPHQTVWFTGLVHKLFRLLSAAIALFAALDSFWTELLLLPFFNPLKISLFIHEKPDNHQIYPSIEIPSNHVAISRAFISLLMQFFLSLLGKCFPEMAWLSSREIQKLTLNVLDFRHGRDSFVRWLRLPLFVVQHFILDVERAWMPRPHPYHGAQWSRSEILRGTVLSESFIKCLELEHLMRMIRTYSCFGVMQFHYCPVAQSNAVH